MRKLRSIRACVGASAATLLLVGGAGGAEYRGRVVDSRTGDPIASRVYLRAPDGDWLFVETAGPEGRARPYREQWVPMPGSTSSRGASCLTRLSIAASSSSHSLVSWAIRSAVLRSASFVAATSGSVAVSGRSRWQRGLSESLAFHPPWRFGWRAGAAGW